MENLEQILLKVMNTINTYMADYVLIILLVGIGLYFTVRTRFVQIRCFGEGMKKVFGDENVFTAHVRPMGTQRMQ